MEWATGRLCTQDVTAHHLETCALHDGPAILKRDAIYEWLDLRKPTPCVSLVWPTNTCVGKAILDLEELTLSKLILRCQGPGRLVCPSPLYLSRLTDQPLHHV